MDQRQIEDIVRSVLGQLGQTNNAASTNATASVVTGIHSTPTGGDNEPLPDLGNDEFQQKWIGVQNPKNRAVLEELRASTRARVCCGRSGPRPRTTSLLRFLADHSRSKDTVLKEIPEDWVIRSGLIEVQTEVTDKDMYLTRPDLGRKLSQSGIDTLLRQCKKGVQVQIVVSDGLSTDAVTANYDEIFPPLLKGLENAG